MRRKALVASIVVAVALALIGFPQASAGLVVRDRLVPARVLDLPADEYSTIAWLANGDVLASRGSKSATNPVELVRLHPGDDPVRLELPPRPECSSVLNFAEVRLSATEAVVSVHCTVSGPQAGTVSILALDATTGATRPLAELGSDLYPYGGLDWNGAKNFGVASDGFDVCGTLGLLTQDGVQPIHAKVPTRTKPFWLDEASNGANCDRKGLATSPVLSPSGDRFAFTAAPADTRFRGPARSEQPREFFVLEIGAKKAHRMLPIAPVFAGLGDWSPDGRWLTFQANDVEGLSGAFLLNVKTGEVIRFARGRVGGAQFSADGTHALLMREIVDEDHPLKSNRRIVEYDLTTIVSPAN